MQAKSWDLRVEDRVLKKEVEGAERARHERSGYAHSQSCCEAAVFLIFSLRLD